MENTSYNIPSVTVGDVIRILADLYTAAFQEGTLSGMPSAALWGPMGVGKSTAVKTLAGRVSERTGQKVTVTDIRLLNFSPVDLRGIPAADARHEFTVWLKPKIFDLSGEGIQFLFLDEISAAPQSLQAAAYQIALDKRIGEHELPANCIVICAGNRTTDMSVAYRMPKALANRLMHFEIRPAFDSWYEWAVENGMDERVMGYLAFDNSRLNTEPGVEELAFPTPRSWEFVSRVLKTSGKPPQELHELISACVGSSAAGEFEAWCLVYRELPAAADILSGKSRKPVKGTDAMYALVSSLTACIAGKGEKIAVEELENACRYVSAFPADFSALFFRGLMRLEGPNLRLMKVPAFLEWMKKNRRFL